MKDYAKDCYFNHSRRFNGSITFTRKNGKYYDDLVNDYIYYLELRAKLKKDIKDKGLRYKTTNAAGKEVEKPNESIVNITKVTTLMLKILSELKLNEPIVHPPSNKKDKVEDDPDDLL